MPKKFTKEVAQNWLDENYPQYRVLDWGGNSQVKSLFIDTTNNREFEITFTNLKVHLKEGRAIGTFKETENNCKMWLKENASHIEIIEWGGLASKTSKFKDTKRNIEFEYDFRTLKHEIKKNSNYIPRMSCDEKKIFLINQKIEDGTSIIINGETIRNIAERIGCSISFIHKLRRFGYSDEFIQNYQKNKTYIEVSIENILKECNIEFKYEPNMIGNCLPDYVVENFKLVIECNGLFWHNEESPLVKTRGGKLYHKKKKNMFDKAGYKSLFFNEDEIRDKSHIVKSIIKHHLNLDKRIFARKCQIEELAQEKAKLFFSQNHLMGEGSGRTYCLCYENNIVGAIQVKWKNNNERILEVSRFCSKNGISVVGGFSKLIKEVIRREQPNKIITFIDKRYGDGNYLQVLGWKFIGEHLSFKWTDFKQTFHRMKYPGNSGLENGLSRIWDCGQAKWQLDVK